MKGQTMTDFYDVMTLRRSNYSLDDRVELSEPQIMELINHAVKQCPSAFNSQSARVIVLFNEHQQKFWNLTLKELEKVTPKDKLANTEKKIASFAAARGTILFFEDEDVIKGLQNNFPLYKDKFPVWSEQGNAILQYAVWCLLADNGIGASLQHYSPLVDSFVHKEWQAPENWKLIAQMPFGRITGEPGPKDYLPRETRVKIFS